MEFSKDEKKPKKLDENSEVKFLKQEEKLDKSLNEVIEQPVVAKIEANPMPLMHNHPGFQGLFQITPEICSNEYSVDFSQPVLSASTSSVKKNLNSSCKSLSNFCSHVGSQFIKFSTIPTVRFKQNYRPGFDDSTSIRTIDFSQL